MVGGQGKGGLRVVGVRGCDSRGGRRAKGWGSRGDRWLRVVWGRRGSRGVHTVWEVITSLRCV